MRFAALPGDRRMRTKVDVFCRWRRSLTAWSGGSRQDRRYGPPDLARLGASVQRARPGGSLGPLDERAEVAVVAGSVAGNWLRSLKLAPM
jgi:hypothetical protein